MVEQDVHCSTSGGFVHSVVQAIVIPWDLHYTICITCLNIVVCKEFKASLWLPNGGNWNEGITCQSRYLEYRYRYYPRVGNGNPLQYP